MQNPTFSLMNCTHTFTANFQCYFSRLVFLHRNPQRLLAQCFFRWDVFNAQGIRQYTYYTTLHKYNACLLTVIHRLVLSSADGWTFQTVTDLPNGQSVTTVFIKKSQYIITTGNLAPSIYDELSVSSHCQSLISAFSWHNNSKYHITQHSFLLEHQHVLIMDTRQRQTNAKWSWMIYKGEQYCYSAQISRQ